MYCLCPGSALVTGAAALTAVVPLPAVRRVVLQDKRNMKIGLDLSLGVGKKLNENKTMDHTALKKGKDADAANKVFTVSK